MEYLSRSPIPLPVIIIMMMMTTTMMMTMMIIIVIIIIIIIMMIIIIFFLLIKVTQTQYTITSIGGADDHKLLQEFN